MQDTVLEIHMWFPEQAGHHFFKNPMFEEPDCAVYQFGKGEFPYRANGQNNEEYNSSY